MGKGGSQLAQLKNRATSEGLRGDPGGKKRSSTANTAGGDVKARTRRDARAALDDAFSSTFDTKVTKQKKDILTRADIQKKNAKGTVGRPTESKSAALASREAQLLPHLQDRHKSGAFVDRRFGENDPNMSVEQRMLERFTAERKRQLTNGTSATARRAGKASLFNLDDSEDEGLTHFGQSLSAMDDGMLGAGVGPDEEEDEGPQQTYNPFDDEIPDGVAREDAQGKPRSKEDIMAEVMLKSKNAKLERQRAREQDEETRYELDDALQEIRHDLLAMKPAPTRPSEAAHQPASAATSSETTPATGANATPADAGNVYDALYRSLVYERRAQPTDRMKTEEERAAEEAERLQAAERERQRRMRGDSDDEAAAEDEAVATGAGKRKRAKLLARHEQREPGADDLDDDFVLDGVSAGEAYGLGQGLAAEPASDENEDGDQGEDGGSDKSEDEEEDAKSGDSDSDEEGLQNHEHNYNDLADLEGLSKPGEEMDSDEEAVAGGEAEDLVGRSGKKSKPSASKDAKQLPYTFPAPETHSDFLHLLHAHNVETQQVPTVVKRIRTLYNPSLGPQNREHSEALLQILVDHMLYLGGQAQEAAATESSSDLSTKEAISLLNTLLPHVLDLVKLFPDKAAHTFCNKLALMQRNLTRGLTVAATGGAGRTWPSFAELSFLRLVCLVWPTSDHSHPVSTSAQILISQYLAHARIRPTTAVSDTASGLYLASLSASYERESKRLVSEAINFLHVVLLGLMPLSGSTRKAALHTAAEYGVAYSADDVSALASLRPKLQGKAAAQERPASLVMGEAAWKERADLIGLLTWKGEPRQAGQILLSQSLKLVETFSSLYAGCEAYIELFRPLESIVSAVSTPTGDVAALSQILKQRIGNAQRGRRFLRLQAHRAKALDMHAPKFSVSGVSTDPDPERAEASKLRALHKKERKSTIRELRRDARFTASIKDKERQEEDARYKKHIDRIMADLQSERSEEKKFEREKAALKRKR